METMPTLAEALANTGGIPSAFTKDDQPGTRITGVVDHVEMRQINNYETGEPETWANGEPKMQVVITVNTSNNEQRRVYVKWFGTQKQELAAAIRAANAGDIQPGGTFTATFTGLGEQTNPRLNPPKLYTYAYTPPASPLAGAVAQTKPAPTQTQQPQPQQPQQTPPASDLWGPPTPAPGTDPALAQKIEQLRNIGLDTPAIAAALGITTAQAETGAPF